MTTRDYSDKQEQHIAKVTGGKVQSNSGGTKFGGGDVHTDKFFIEAKTPTKEQTSFTIKKEWITKLQEQTFEQGKEEAVLAFRFSPDDKTDMYVLNERQFLEYLKFKADNISTEFDRPLPQKGEKYKHFKLGKIVTIVGISRHTETEEISVVYDYEGHIWNRPLEMFMSEVDKEKYPNAKQRYRFELIESEE